ncbi:hypothetical protein ES707_00995 [subsurface metagenome]
MPPEQAQCLWLTAFRQDEANRAAHTRFMVTKTFEPFVMVR